MCVDRKLWIFLCCGFGGYEFGSYIARQILIGSYILSRLGCGDTEDNALQVLNDFFFRFACKLFHIGQVNTGFFTDRQGKSFACGFNGSDFTVGLYRPFREHIRFSFEIALIVKHLQRTQKEVALVRCKSEIVSSAVDKSVLLRKAVIQTV